MDLNLNLECYGQTNPEGRARLTRRLIMDLVFIVIFEIEYSMLLRAHFAENRRTKVLMISGWKRQYLVCLVLIVLRQVF